MKKVFYLLTFMLCLCTSMKAQVVYEDIANKALYDYLDEMANEKIISLNASIKPYSRLFIAEKLQEISLSAEKLNKRQKGDLQFYLRDFNKELLQNKYKPHRLDLLYYKDSVFTFSLNGILGGQGWKNENGFNYHRWFGAEAFGYAGKHFGMYASLRDNQEKIRLSDTNVYTIRNGAMYKTLNPSDYSEMRGGITLAWKWGTIGLVKDHFEWGTNYRYPNLISSKTPSFAHIKLHLYPAKWFEFNYIHGWLVSDVVDSSRSYNYNGKQRDVFHNKYIAANLFTFKPLQGLNLSFGNSIVYSDIGVHPAYLIPVLFYKSVDHTYNSATNNAGQNSQLFFDISCRLIKHTNFYYTMYLDELSFSRMFDKAQSNHWSMKWGARLSNVLPNTIFTAEYTRTNPLAYQNDIPTTLYTSNSYYMGHYLKDNADELYLALEVRPLSRLIVKTWYSQARKGPEYPYIRQIDPETGITYVHGKLFMQSVKWKQQLLGFKAEYQVLNDFFVFIELEKQLVEGNYQRYNSEFYQGNALTWSFGMNFGFY